MSCACLDASLTPSETGPELVLISDFLYPHSGKVEAKQDFLRMKLRGTKKTLLITESFFTPTNLLCFCKHYKSYGLWRREYRFYPLLYKLNCPNILLSYFFQYKDC